mmetsp:Transcript_4183/g.5565  ORF Transcript_4183/g.5565 Transcript_4183/m.5565 type:complete len:118 (-) Transcript_4183:487-840(-)
MVEQKSRNFYDRLYFWTQEQTFLLLEALDLYGPDSNLIATYMKGIKKRTQILDRINTLRLSFGRANFMKLFKPKTVTHKFHYCMFYAKEVDCQRYYRLKGRNFGQMKSEVKPSALVD